MPHANRTIVLRRTPRGLVAPGDLEIVEQPCPEPREGQALVATEFLAMDPINRIMLEHDIKIIAPILPGEPVRGFGSGIVVASRNANAPVGAHVTGFFNWADYQIYEDGGPLKIIPQDVPLDAALNVYGHTAMAAYFGVTEVGKVKAGDVTLVTGAAGAVGSVAGQIAKIKGAHVIGIAGGPKKLKWLLDDLGFDEAVDYKSDTFKESLAQACRGGIDVLFDNVSGDLLDMLAGYLNPGARVVACGMSSQIGSGSWLPLTAHAGVAARGATITPFNAMTYAPQIPDAAVTMLAWQAQGVLKTPQMILSGFESALMALNHLFNGESRGRLLVRVAAAG